MTHSARVVVIGDALIDELRDEQGVREFVGGAALNVAVGLSRLGVASTLIAMVGDDAAGDRIRSFLADYRVELLASPAPSGTSRAVSTRSAAGEPEYVFNEAAQHRAVLFGERERAAIASAPLTVVSCVPFDDPEQTDALADALALAPAVAIDPNPRAGMMRDRDEFVRGFERLAAGVALVKVGDDDARLLYGTDLDVLRDRLLAAGVAAVLATRGAGGAQIVAGEVRVSSPISQLPGSIVDTMGAGDAVLSSIAASLVNQAPHSPDEWADALTRAMDVAAATCRFEGALLRTPDALGESGLARSGS